MENEVPSSPPPSKRKKTKRKKGNEKDDYSLTKVDAPVRDMEVENGQLVAKVIESSAQPNTVTSKVGRNWTLAIAVPISILDHATSPEMRSYFAGQVARAAAIFCADEIVIYDDSEKSNGEAAMLHMARIFQYLECPQYLRKDFFPYHEDLQYVGLLNPLDGPHHLRTDERCPYREGVVVECDRKQRICSVNVGLFRLATVADTVLEPGTRVTLKFRDLTDDLAADAVPSHAPRTEAGLYWGYDVRVAGQFNQIFLQSPHPDGYDLTVGLSRTGTPASGSRLQVPPFSNACLVVAGGRRSFDQLLGADPKIQIDEADQFFDLHVSTIPSTTADVRTEESLLISLSVLRPHLAAAAATATVATTPS